MRALVLLVCLLLIVAFLPALVRGQATQIRDVTEDDVGAFDLQSIVVRPKPGTRDSPRPLSEADARSLGLDPQPRPNAAGSFIYKPEAGPPGSDQDKLRRLLETLEKLKAMHPRLDANLNRRYFPEVAPRDAYYPSQWSLHNAGATVDGRPAPGAISVEAAWRHGFGNADVTVAVLDTGIVKHPDIERSANIGKGYDFVSRDDDPTDPGDARKEGECGDSGEAKTAKASSWHGSHVAGIIGIGKSDNGEGIAGIAFDVRVLPVRIAGPCGATNDAMVNAIAWAAGLHGSHPAPIARNLHRARIITISFGRPFTPKEPQSCDPDLQAVISRATAAGAIVVVSAGNDKKDIARHAIASCRDVVPVAASDRDGKLWEASNFGAGALVAPGVDIASYVNPSAATDDLTATTDAPCKAALDLIATDGITCKTGTSMAAAHVAGVMALMLAKNPDLKRPELLAILNRTGRDIDCPQPCGKAKLIDAGRAVAEAAAPRSPSPPSPPPPPPDGPRPPREQPEVLACGCCCWRDGDQVRPIRRPARRHIHRPGRPYIIVDGRRYDLVPERPYRHRRPRPYVYEPEPRYVDGLEGGILP